MYDYTKTLYHNSHPQEVEGIFNFIKEICPVKKGRAGQRFTLQQNNIKMCLILYQGTCIIRRIKDSLVLSTIKAPNMVGLYDLYHEKSEIQVIANSDIEFRLVSIEELLKYTDQHHQWKNFCYFLLLSATRFCDYQKENAGISNYELICNMLTSLENESFEIRATTTALEYIQERSKLSRSGIMKTLSTLREGGYITIKNGLLINILYLPKKF
jgi:CRP-like cAMP-binding protein